MELSYELAGECAIILYLPEPVQSNYPHLLRALVETLLPLELIDYVPAYHSLLLVYDSKKHSPETLYNQAQQYLNDIVSNQSHVVPAKKVRVPVCYEDSFALDMNELSTYSNISIGDIVDIHTSKTYTVCCLGFIPGFGFLGDVDDIIAMPRRATPRHSVATGSVGIAGKQTGVYPATSPGGWNIIGCTPMKLYDPKNGIISRFSLGDSVEFYAISKDEFLCWSESDACR